MSEPHHDQQHTMGHDHPAVHGMLLVGEARAFLSHLPMFHPPHDYQVLLEVELYADGGDPFGAYVQDRRECAEPIYTWVPEPFKLSGLVAEPTAAFSMSGTIVRGHFERGGIAISSANVQARVTRVLYARQFTANASDPESLDYLLFGAPGDAFLAHLIKRAPDFDQVCAAKLAAPPTGWDGEALVLRIPGRGNGPDQRLMETEAVAAVVLAAEAPATVTLTTERVHYFETGDLAA